MPLRFSLCAFHFALHGVHFVEVESAVPIIYTRTDRPQRVAWGIRLLSLGVAGAFLSLLLLAAKLTPSPSGVATHRGLGLPACEFMVQTGLPCPSCGMTTSFAWFVRGNLLASLYVQPMGTVIAALACVCVWAGFYITVTGRPIYRLLELIPARYLYLPVLGFALVAWAWKISIHLTGHDGW